MILYLVVALIGALVIGGVVVGVRAAGRGRAAEPLPGTPEELRDRIRALCAAGRRIEAVKLARQTLPGIGLQQAKQMVDAVAAGRDIPLGPGAMTSRLPPALHERVRQLLRSNRTLEAVKVVRQELPGMSLKAARDAVLAVGRGAPPAVAPSPSPRPIGEDLAARVRRLKADGRRDQAIFLVRGETGMDHDEASAFVDAIETEERSGGGEERREPPAQDTGRG